MDERKRYRVVEGAKFQRFTRQRNLCSRRLVDLGSRHHVDRFVRVVGSVAGERDDNLLQELDAARIVALSRRQLRRRLFSRLDTDTVESRRWIMSNSTRTGLCCHYCGYILLLNFNKKWHTAKCRVTRISIFFETEF